MKLFLQQYNINMHENAFPNIKGLLSCRSTFNQEVYKTSALGKKAKALENRNEKRRIYLN